MTEIPSETPKVPDTVMAVLHDAANYENKLRDGGVSEARIKKLAHIPLNQELIRLSLNKVDIAAAFPPEQEVASSDPELTEAEERKVDHLVDTMGIGYAEAIKRVKG